MKHTSMAKMAAHSSHKTPNSLHLFSIKPPSFHAIKLKTIFHTFIFPHVYRIARPVAKAKSLVLKLIRDIHLVEFSLKRNKNKSPKKVFFGSFRLHYNWCSSHVMPLGHHESYCSSHVYYDSNWNSVIPTTSSSDCEQMQEPDELSRYLQWLEEKGNNQESSCCNEIDRLADMFIADCHEKFRLEKQESYRRFQEMMARSV